MQYVVALSRLTYECTQVTPSCAFSSTTPRHCLAPASSTGIASPSGNERSTKYRGILSVLHSRPLPSKGSLCVSEPREIGAVPYVAGSGSPCCASAGASGTSRCLLHLQLPTFPGTTDGGRPELPKREAQS